LLVFYISGLYELHRLRNSIEFFSTVTIALAVNVIIAISFFYTFSPGGITPKTNLASFSLIFSTLFFLWRRSFNSYAAERAVRTKVLLIGKSDSLKNIEETIEKNPNLGFAIKAKKDATIDIKQLTEEIKEKNIELVIVSSKEKENNELKTILLDLLPQSIEVYDDISFHERLLKKIPIKDLEPSWFWQNGISAQTLYDQFKRTVEIGGGILLQIILLPLELLIAVLIKTTSAGPIIYKQTRVGKNNKIFTLYKFRTMRTDAEKNGPQWSTPKDARVTPIGKLLRHSHLDELPQLINIIKGEVTFVGPRPERPEFVEKLKQVIPFYQMRHLITPGITGWAQINWKKDTDVEDVMRKLEFDLYYVKHRSAMFDIAIIIKTIKAFFINA
jgi:exopolysaccharide biosynthesis polyprenyl glycosylphosphotransferase